MHFLNENHDLNQILTELHIIYVPLLLQEQTEENFINLWQFVCHLIQQDTKYIFNNGYKTKFSMALFEYWIPALVNQQLSSIFNRR